MITANLGDFFKVMCIKDFPFDAYNACFSKEFYMLKVVEREEVRWDGEKYYYDIFRLNDGHGYRHLGVFYDETMLNDYFISLGDFREERIEEIFL